jgi:hypothetical protein
MPALANLPFFRSFFFLKDAAIRMGIYVGVSMSIIFSVWLIVANRMSLLDPLALERNIGAAALMGFFACLPILRFYRFPNDLLLSGVLGWTLLALTYRMFCFKFTLLEEYYSAFHIFVLGAICYLVFATVSWIGTIIWRVHATSSSHTQHH